MTLSSLRLVLCLQHTATTHHEGYAKMHSLWSGLDCDILFSYYTAVLGALEICYTVRSLSGDMLPKSASVASLTHVPY